MSPFTGLVWLCFLIALLPAVLVAVLVTIVEPGFAAFGGVLAFGFSFTEILNWIVAPKSGGK